MVLLCRILRGEMKQQSREGILVGRLLFVMADGAGSRRSCLEGRTYFFVFAVAAERANKGIDGL